MQEEGREARNLVAYSLPLLDPPQTETGESLSLRHHVFGSNLYIFMVFNFFLSEFDERN